MLQCKSFCFHTLRLDLLAASNATAAEPPSLITHTVDNTIYSFSGRSSVLVTAWQAMAVVRAVCCVSAWLVIACLNDYDRLDGESTRSGEYTHCTGVLLLFSVHTTKECRSCVILPHWVTEATIVCGQTVLRRCSIHGYCINW